MSLDHPGPTLRPAATWPSLFACARQGISGGGFDGPAGLARYAAATSRTGRRYVQYCTPKRLFDSS